MAPARKTYNLVLVIGIWLLFMATVGGTLLLMGSMPRVAPQAAPSPVIIVQGGHHKGDAHILPPHLPVSPSANRINIHTRGEPPEAQQVGMLVAPSGSDRDPIMLPLFGNPVNSRSDRWEYYAAADKQHLWRIPIEVNNRDCSDENVGCQEVSNGDSVHVPTYDGKEFTASIYKKQGLRYIA